MKVNIQCLENSTQHFHVIFEKIYTSSKSIAWSIDVVLLEMERQNAHIVKYINKGMKLVKSNAEIQGAMTIVYLSCFSDDIIMQQDQVFVID